MKDLFALTIPSNNGPVAISPPPGIPSGSGYSVVYLATVFLQVAVIVGILLALFYLIYGGIFWMQASGDKQKWDKARRIILSSILGLIILSLSLVLVNVITSALGVNGLVNQIGKSAP